MKTPGLPLLAVALLAGVILNAAEPAVPPPPGVVVATSPNPEHNFVGSPSILILPDGSYLVSHDFFGRKTDPGAKALLHSSRVFASRDKGRTWTQLAHLRDQFWSTLFYHNGAVWLLGANREYGEIVIRKSTDGGRTWTTPADARSGLLTERGGREFHCAPVPVVIHDGRIWRAFEDYTGGPEQKWSGDYFGALVISAPVEADLLDAKSWTPTRRVAFKPAWLPGPRNGWLEGNVVPGPGGRLVEIMRLNDDPPAPAAKDFPHTGSAAGIPRFETAALLEVKDETTLTFDPKTGFIHFPGGITKFTIRHDPRTNRYWSLVNKITNPRPGYTGRNHPRVQRNVIMLTSSPDLRNWTEHSVILRWGEGRELTSRDKFGFQYLDWQFDGDDLIAVSRTAWDAYNIHNSNCVTFHRVKDFRTLTMAGSPPDLAHGQ
jgi:hypothetical protein